MHAILAGLAALFGFLKLDKAVSVVLKVVGLGPMILVNTALLVALFSYAGGVLGLLLFVYSKINQLIETINNVTSGGGDEILTWALQLFKALGIWNAFVDVFYLFSGAVIAILVLFASRLALKVLHSIQRILIAYNIARL